MPNSEDAEKSTGKTTLLAACAGRLSAVRQSQLDPQTDIQRSLRAIQLLPFVHQVWRAATVHRGNDSGRLIPIDPVHGHGHVALMEQRIVHACGHEQVHVIYGFDAQVARKARWLRTIQCRTCFIADKQAEQAKEAAGNEAAIAHLDLPELSGSERQITWANAVRAGRLAALMLDPVTTAEADCAACLSISDAKWWIDHRTVPLGSFVAKAQAACASPHASSTTSDRVQAA